MPGSIPRPVDPVDPAGELDRDRLVEGQVLIHLGVLAPRQLEIGVAELVDVGGLGLVLGLDVGINPAGPLAIERILADLPDVPHEGRVPLGIAGHNAVAGISRAAHATHPARHAAAAREPGHDA
jgi:hypothetical protein